MPTDDHPLSGEALASAIDYNERKAPNPSSIPPGAKRDFPGLSRSPRGSSCDREAFAQATYDVQGAVNVAQDGKYGPGTTSAVNARYDIYPGGGRGLLMLPPVGITLFCGFILPTRDQMKQFRDAGVDRLLYNVNVAVPPSQGFVPQWDRDKLADNMRMGQDEGFDVGPMPWMYRQADISRDLADYTLELCEDVQARECCFNVEAHWEYGSDGSTPEEAMELVFNPYWEPKPEDLIYSAIGLYFRRPYCDALYQACTEVHFEEYSQWMDSKPDTKTMGYQPGQVHETGWYNHRPLVVEDGPIQEVIPALGAFHQTRPYKPSILRNMTTAFATARGLGAARVSVWAGNTITPGKFKDAEENLAAFLRLCRWLQNLDTF